MEGDDYNGWLALVANKEKTAEMTDLLGLKAAYVSDLEIKW
jgi:hypothetical protein